MENRLTPEISTIQKFLYRLIGLTCPSGNDTFLTAEILGDST